MQQIIIPNWFIALPIPAGRWYFEVIEKAPAGVKAFHPDDLHLTLAFLGKFNRDRLENVCRAMELSKIRPFVFIPSRTIALPSASRISAIAVIPEQGYKEARAIIADWRGLFSEAGGIEPDARTPLPHCTIARPNRFGIGARRTILDWIAAIHIPREELIIDSVALYTRNCDRSIQQFKIIAKFPLA